MMERIIILEEQAFYDAQKIQQLENALERKNEMLNLLQASALGIN